MRHAQYQIDTSKYLSLSEQSLLTPILKRNPCRDTLAIEVLLATGARATELLNIEPSHLNHDDRSVLILGIKGSNNREIPLSKDLFTRLVLASSNGKPFPMSYSRLQAAWYLYRPVKKKLHSTRHTFAVNLYLKTKDLLLVKVALGHRSLSNTMAYAVHISAKNDLRKALV